MRFVSPILKRIVYPALSTAGYFRALARPGLAVITYHGVLPQSYKPIDPGFDGSLITASTFRQQLRLLKKKYTIISPEEMRSWSQNGGDLPPRDRLSSVFFAVTAHDEVQPPHLHVSDRNICATTCATEYGNPCTRFCPAQVYEMVDDDAGGKKLQINAANCVHCKACDIKDPYQIIDWVTPEGGSGPNYQLL